MPRIDEKLSATIKKPFKKKAYRPWDLLGEALPVGNPIQAEKENSSNIDPLHNKLEINKEPISNQKEDSKATNKNSISNQNIINAVHLVTKNSSKSNHNITNISNQLGNIQADNYPFEKVLEEVKRLYGIQKRILFYIVDVCLVRGELCTGAITNETLRLVCNANVDTVKTAAQRLVNKGFISREKGKRGKGGFTNFVISESIRKAVIEEAHQLKNSNHLVLNLSNTLVTNSGTNKEPRYTTSSSSYYKTTTISENDTNFSSENQLDHQWDSIDIEILKEIGFTKAHLAQIVSDSKLTPEIVQDSLYAFAYDLEHNNKGSTLKTTPLNYFMGILRKGKPYLPPPNYESPEDKALRIYLERKGELEKKRAEIEKELIMRDFKDWLSNLSEEEKNKLLPKSLLSSNSEFAKTGHLKKYHSENIWPLHKEKILKGLD